MNVDPDGHFSFLVFLAVVVASTLIGAVSGGVAAVRAGQNFWKGFGAGALAGFIGGVISGLSGILGHSLFFSLAGRVVGSLSYSILNEKVQTGTISWSNLGTYAFDAAEDAIFSTVYFGVASSLAGKFSSSLINLGKIASPISQRALEKGSEAIVTGIFDFGIDNFQFDIYSSSLSQTIRSLMENCWNSMQTWTAPKMVLN